MFCTKCGKKLKKKEQFCPNCGKNVNEEIPTPVVATPIDDSKSKKSAIIVVIIVVALMILAILAFVGIVIAIVFFAIDTVSKAENIELLGEEIPTVYKVTGEDIRICSIESRSDLHIKTVEYDYCDRLSDEDAKEYFDYLVENHGFVYKTDVSGEYLSKEERGLLFTIYKDSKDKITYSVLMVNNSPSGKVSA